MMAHQSREGILDTIKGEEGNIRKGLKARCPIVQLIARRLVCVEGSMASSISEDPKVTGG